MIYLTTKLILPGSGVYRFKLLDPTSLKETLEQGLKSEQLFNKIADPEPLEILNTFTGLDISLASFSKASENIELYTDDSFIVFQTGYDEKTEQILIKATQAFYFGDTPSGMVACVIDAQRHDQTEETPEDWYLKFRDEMRQQVDMSHIKLVETTKIEGDV